MPCYTLERANSHDKRNGNEDLWGLPLICFYAVVGILNGHFINKSRFERYVYADSAKKLAEIQQNYNEELKKEVAEKTAGIVALHDKFILGMATMVESRDNSTGGHIKRTSDVVRFLTDAIREAGTFHLSEGFCEKVMKAAPMHDLGKIAVDDVILSILEGMGSRSSKQQVSTIVSLINQIYSPHSFQDTYLIPFISHVTSPK